MSRRSDQTYILTHQARSGVNLEARRELHRRIGTIQVKWHRLFFDHLTIPLPASPPSGSDSLMRV